MSYREGRFWQPDVTVATVVVATDACCASRSASTGMW